jgi:integrase
MSDRPRLVPSYRRHKQSGQAIVTLTDGQGGRRDVLLGKHGTKASRLEYARVIAEWEAGGRGLVLARAAGPDLAVNELAAAFLQHAEAHYRDADGKPTNELAEFRYCIRQLRELYGHTPAQQFGPLALKALRSRLVEANLSRGVVNCRIGRVRHIFKWGVAEELVPDAVHSAMTKVPGLAKGRTAAHETEPVRPVPDAFVDAVLPFVLPPIRAMIELQRLTGMRPGEVVRMRAADLETGGRVWFYRPAQHKTAWRGKDRVISLGPKSQAIVREFLATDTQAPLFSPSRAMAVRSAELRAARKTKVQPSQRRRRVRRPQRRPGDRYTVGTYRNAIRRACDLADRTARQAAEDAKATAEGRLSIDVPARLVDANARLVPHWHPNQIRHSFATTVRRKHGLEAAQVMLGHAKANMTEVYAEKNLDLAEQIALDVG